MTTYSTSTNLDTFREEWLVDVRAGSPHTLDLGRRFAVKLLTQWLDIDSDAPDLVHCDGSGDGGIDLAYLSRGESERDEGVESVEGDTWYLVQSKYGTAFAGVGTVLVEGQKVIDTLDGRRPRLSSLAEGLLGRLSTFRARMAPQDRIVLVLATERAMSEAERRCLHDVRAMGRERIGANFDVEEVSVETIYLRHEAGADERVRVPLLANLVKYGDDLLVGAVALPELYAFLKGFQEVTRDLDRLYARNVRQFLGSRRKINKGIQTTLVKTPERFGLYNNGITVVVDAFEGGGGAPWLLTEPYVVNGCQTTRSLWEVLQAKLESGGTGSDSDFDAWRGRLDRGVVVMKVVRVGPGADAQIADITRYTNSQNAVREKDFIALEGDFQQWQAGMADIHNIYVEIQRGGWDSRRAWQRQNPHGKQFELSANAFDLVKVYGAGWMGEPGTGYGRNASFVPGGTIFQKIVEPDPVSGDAFGLGDLYASWLIQRSADAASFGRGTQVTARRQSRYLYYFVLVELLKDLLRFAGSPSPTRRNVTKSVIRLASGAHDALWKELVDEALAVIDEYLTHGGEDTAFNEPAFINTFNNDLNSYLKWEGLGKNEENSPRLRTLIALARRALGKSATTGGSTRDRVKRALTGAT